MSLSNQEIENKVNKLRDRITLEQKKIARARGLIRTHEERISLSESAIRNYQRQIINLQMKRKPR